MDEIKTMVSIPTSFYYQGMWQTAMWSAMVVDRDTGDVLLTACLPGVAGDQAAAAIAALRLGMEDVARLRELAGFGGGVSQRIGTGDYDCRTTGERVEVLERSDDALQCAVADLEERIARIEGAFRRLADVCSGRPNAEEMIDLGYDAEHDAGPVSWVDMRMLELIRSMRGLLYTISAEVTP